MRRSTVLLATAIPALSLFAAGEKIDRTRDWEVVIRAVNYDKAKIAPYKLEDVLEFADGRKVTKADWQERRREILDIFAKEMYGCEPPRPEQVVTDLVDEKISAAGFAVRRQYKMYFRADKSGPCINWIVWVPRYARKPVPVISFLNYRGNYCGNNNFDVLHIKPPPPIA